MIQNRNRNRKKIQMMTACLVSMFLVSACSNGNNGGNAPNAGSSAAANGGTDPEPFGSYDPPIEMSTVRDVLEGTEFPPGDSWDDNVWYRAMDEQLGIKVNNKWMVPNAQFEQKMNVSIVSGDLPDLIPVSAKQLQTMVKAGLVEDMTPIFEQYASPLLKESLQANDSLALKSATYDGKLMAIPGYVQGTDAVDLIWIRTDWLAKLHLDPPKTMDDLVKIMKAFTLDDPDGNGKNDTYGLNLNKTLWDGYSGLRGFFNGFHAYPYSDSSTSMWIKDADGKLVYGAIQPEMKPALLQLQELYKAGAIDPQFVVYDGPKSSENEKNEKTGLHFGQFWNVGLPIDASDKKKNPKMEWQPFSIVSVDGKPANAEVVTPQSTWFYAVKKGYKHPEALVKMLNLYYEKLYGETADPSTYHTAHIDGKDYGVFGYSPVDGQIPDKNQIAYKRVQEAVETGDATKLNLEQKQYYDALLKYTKDGNVDFWGADTTWGEHGAYAVISDYKDSGRMLINAFLGAPTPTMAQKGSILMDMETQMITKIILGSPIGLFDQFVKDWKASGGDQITQEVNDWYASSK